MLLTSPVGLFRSGTMCRKNECVPEVFGIVNVAVPFPLLTIDAPPKPPTSDGWPRFGPGTYLRYFHLSFSILKRGCPRFRRFCETWDPNICTACPRMPK